MSATTGGSAGLLTSYNSVGSLSGATDLNSLTVPAEGWYDVTVWAWNTGTTGVAGTDDENIGLYSDAVDSGTPALQSIVVWTPFKIAAACFPIPFRMRVYAQTEILLKSIGSGTSGAVVASILAAAPPGGGAESMLPVAVG
jgi:hypothetical protein